MRRCFKERRVEQLAHTGWRVQLPVQVGRANLVGSLRLLYQVWDPSDDLAHSDRMPMIKSSLDLLTTSLDLPRCFPFDFANRKPIPIRLKVNKTSNGDNLSIVPLFLIFCRQLATDRVGRDRLPEPDDIGLLHDYGTVIQAFAEHHRRLPRISI
jgi:hypothetical protein